MSAEFLPVWPRRGISISSMAASCRGAGVAGEAAPVGVGLLGDDLALLDEALEHAGDVEAVAAALEAQGEVLEVDEDGQGAIAFGHVPTCVNGCRDCKRRNTIASYDLTQIAGLFRVHFGK